MEKLYFKPKKFEKIEPKNETIQSILNYSKSYSVTKYNKIVFDNFLN